MSLCSWGSRAVEKAYDGSGQGLHSVVFRAPRTPPLQIFEALRKVVKKTRRWSYN